jgi:hypothetical protein
LGTCAAAEALPEPLRQINRSRSPAPRGRQAEPPLLVHRRTSGCAPNGSPTLQVSRENMGLMATREQQQFLIYIIALLVILECVAWGVACILTWAFWTADQFGAAYPPERLQNTVVAMIVTAMLILNIVATVAILRNKGFGLSLIALVQGANVFATIGLLNLPLSAGGSGSFPLAVPPAFTLVLVGVLWLVARWQSPSSAARLDA